MTNEPAAQDHETLRSALVALMLEASRRDPASVGAVSDATPCVGGDLLQDSLDVLEFIVALDRVHGVSIRDEGAGKDALANLGTLTRYVAEHRVR